ncbi:bifunctional folylpolyglutamate synthase/dihydrofolate synthase [Leptospira biflexa]|uniref:bifunctional folylpolyglutamate synthase/dihydrofolate synthase n=1 Tax=Leptospira biflexa TaxID=172 RepID=UPI0010915B20|nr:bifunctional folylpolyglutamate synthase/dihydrofolate synthase [Leptospira biflexa]TGM47759.1 bifunctional folylpolyglutamate synthase/dihydrofolate synthase [Leptospira biflexa]TGM49776.1 bifunctional folylpolyglutamate synthase/dihydrofolate synthase [Leptospira biflexa]
MNFLDFLNERQNIEKTRNFNVFQTYTLDGLKPIFEHVKKITQKNVHNPLRISVVGTNGKGSTSHYLACLFSKLGYKVGLYTSPHLISPLERFQLVWDGNPTLPLLDELNLLFQNHFLPEIELYESLSYFEFLTVFAFLFFSEQNTEVQIWEAGLGGRLDATKLVDANHVVLTKIGLDHSAILGNTKEAICQEKLAIIGDRCLSLFAMEEEVESLKTSFVNRPRANSVPLHIFSCPPNESYLETNFLFAKDTISQIIPNIQQNLASLSFQDLPKPRGRMEVMQREPLVVFDPSHNPDAILTTTQEFAKSQSKFHIFLGSLPDKDLKGILEALSPSETKIESLLLWEGEGFGSFPEPTGSLSAKTERVRTTAEILPFFQGRIPILVLGSFRLYGIVANLIQNTIKM